jgi:Tfp pilus assembly protein PilO
MTTETSERRAGWKSNLLARLHDPIQLRIGVVILVFALGYAAIYMPLMEQISATARRLEREQKVLGFAENLEQLQKQYRVFADRVPQQTDTKEWVQYVLEGTRQFPVKVLNLDCRDPRAMGPYRVITLQIDLEGPFMELNRFLAWLEANRRLLRVDDITISPPRNGASSNGMAMHVMVSGLTS